MKTLISLFALSFIACTAIAQSPQKFSYQSVIRNTGNQLVINQSVGVKISILQGSATGSAVYAETHNPLTNANGLATLEIGGGTVLSGNFANINWANGPYFVKTETDLNGGSNYTITSTTQLLSVPYALYSGNGIPVGGTNGQFLTNCNGVPTWTTNGNCPGSILGLNCNQATFTQNGDSSLTITIPYFGGDGNYIFNHEYNVSPAGFSVYSGQSQFLVGSGFLSYTIYGNFSVTDNLSFSATISGFDCSLEIPIECCSAHTCGATNVHNPAKTYGTMTDQQGNVYKTIVIGNQEWMAENLKTSIYRNGETIANITDNAQWGGLTTGAWCYYNNDSQYECPYGKLYNWYAVADPRNICPTGWHVPTDAEWITLIAYLGGAGEGGKMKTTGTMYWFEPNQNANNESGFSGLPGGARENGTSTSFDSFGSFGGWWTSSEVLPWAAKPLDLRSYTGSANQLIFSKDSGLSVRCLRD
jgi:uncharacterized protein (TIGR02145 family)